MSRIERIQQVINKEGLTQSDFANRIGVKKQLVSNWKNLIQEVPEKYLIRIVEEFENIDARWLITGKGGMNDEVERTNNIRIELEMQYKEKLAMKDEIIKVKDELIELLKLQK